MWVFISALSLPALLYGLWGLRKRHGGLGRVGLVAFFVAVFAWPIAMPFAYFGLLIFPALLGLAIVVFAVEMLRARILPVMPLVLLAASPVLVLGLLPVSRVVTNDWYLLGAALAPVVVALMWLGWVMWREPAVDRRGIGPLATA
jgi:hypothetical protein